MGIIGKGIAIDRSIAVYSQFHDFVRIKGKQWQLLIATSTGLEMYSFLFQTIWLFTHEQHVGEGAIISLYLILLGFIIASKLAPLALFNQKIKYFAHHLAFEAESSVEVSTHCEDPKYLADFRRVASFSLLFLSRPPHLTVFQIVVDHNTIMKVVFSVAASVLGKFV